MSEFPVVIPNYLLPGDDAKPLLIIHGGQVFEPAPAAVELAGRFHAKADGTCIAVAKAANNKFGCLSGEGKWLVRPTLTEAREFSPDGLARFCSKGKWGYLDLAAKVAIAPRYENAQGF